MSTTLKQLTSLVYGVLPWIHDKTHVGLSSCFKRQSNFIIKMIFAAFSSINSHIKAAHYIFLIRRGTIELDFKMQRN